jgi:hypothetical protein
LKPDFPEIAKVAQSNADKVLEHFLPGGTREGCEYVVINPMRDDTRPGSFKINLHTGVWKDFADDEGGGGDLISLVAYLQRVSQGKAAAALSDFLGMTRRKPRVVSTFTYHDSEGKTAYTKQRVEPGRNGERKEFFFKHLADGKSKHKRGRASVLYNLPAVLAADIVIIVEGERKADLLNAWGLCATCLDYGAQSKLTQEMVHQLTGKNVVFLPDNDVPGAGYAERNAKLLQGNVESLKIVSLPGLPDKGDIVDWAAIPGNDKTLLLSLISDTQEFVNPEMESGAVHVPEILGNNIQQKREKGKISTDEAAKLMLDSSASLPLYRDDTKTGWTFIDGDIVPIQSQFVEDWLTLNYYNLTGNIPPYEALNGAKRVLEAKARIKGESIALSNRVAWHDGSIFYDMGDGSAVRISPDGFKVTSAPPIFQRWPHQQPQPVPASDGDPWDFLRFCYTPESSRLLILTTLITSFIPGIAHPLWHVNGPEGATKSTFCQLVKRVVDPSIADLQIMQPERENDFLLLLHHHFLIALDNLSGLKNRISDLLCGAVTGTAVSHRMHYTNTDMVILRLKNIVLLNGRTPLISRADLLDRTITLNLDRIPNNCRKELLPFLNEFNAALPSILGGIFATIAKAMTIHQNVTLERLPRLADYARWGYCIAEALGGYGNRFLADYSANNAAQREEIINQNTLATALINIMEGKCTWDTTVGIAWNTISKAVKPGHNDKSFPSKPQELRGALELLKVPLAEAGITYNYGKRNREGVPITFMRHQIDTSDGKP